MTEFKLKIRGLSVSTISRLIQKFKRTGSVRDDILGNVGPKANFKMPENIEKKHTKFLRGVLEHRLEKLHNK